MLFKLDWFNPKATDYWSAQAGRFFSAETGIDIDGAWIDMNEPSSVRPLHSTLGPSV